MESLYVAMGQMSLKQSIPVRSIFMRAIMKLDGNRMIVQKDSYDNCTYAICDEKTLMGRLFGIKVTVMELDTEKTEERIINIFPTIISPRMINEYVMGTGVDDPWEDKRLWFYETCELEEWANGWGVGSTVVRLRGNFEECGSLLLKQELERICTQYLGYCI
jgi:hypothetical protein